MVTGTTTAATIWVTAAIGMTAGAGYAGGALGASLVVRGVLSAVRRLEIGGLQRTRLVRLHFTFDPDGGKTRAHVQRLLSTFFVPPGSVCWGDAEGQVVLSLHMHPHAMAELADELARLPAVRTFRREDVDRVAR
jgi:putative Mg2+ transporter-C (MgtC) family protein